MGLAATSRRVMRKATTATLVRPAARPLQRRFNEPHAPFHVLQRLVGNQVTTRLLSRSRVQRMCDTCEDEQRHEVQSKRGTVESPVVTPDLESYVAGSRGGGQPLPAATRAQYEPRFGGDFSGVRIHTDSRAGQAASAIHAHAFTTGADIYFGAGRFRPGTPTGNRLLAHELTHVVQQSGMDARGVQRQPEGPLGPVPPDSPRSDFDCMINLDAGKPQDYVDCCSRAPVGRPCSSHLLKAMCKIPGVDCDKKKKKKKEKALVCDPGFKPGTTKEYEGQCCPETVKIPNPTECCTKDRIVTHSSTPYCCPAGTIPDAGRKECVTPPPLPPVDICLPGQQTSKGECCHRPLVPRGEKCVDPSPPPPKPRPLPAPIEVFFKKDKPSLKGASTLSGSLTAEGLANLTALTELLRNDALLKVQLVGKASQEGDEPYNLDLGRRRAEMIAEALVAKGVDSSRLTDVPRGDLPNACEDVRTGVVTCGEAGATSEKDRQVLARIVRP
jgi:Domain of unknown function (DUF4157)/OmpA family